MMPEEIKDILKRDLTARRFAHTLGVAETARRLAGRFGIDEARAFLSGLLHDCAKRMTRDEMLEVCRQSGVPLLEMEEDVEPILHAPAGAARARRDFGIEDGDILSAIRTHTVGGAKLSALQKLIYVCDFIEPGRKPFPGLENARALAETNLDRAALECARLSAEYVLSSGGTVHPATIEMIQKLEESVMNEPKDLAYAIAEILDNKKALDIQILRVDHLTSITDYFVIASGRSAQAVHTLYEEVTDKLAEAGIPMRRNDGVRESRWIVLDYASVIVHLFHPEERQFYNIERLWMDGTNQIPFESKGE